MTSGVFSSLDRQGTVEAMRKYLSEWKDWKIKSVQTMPTVGSPSMDGQPHGSNFDPNKQLDEHANAEYEQEERVRSCYRLKSISEDEEVLCDILYYRFIKRWSATRTMMWVNDHYSLYLDERTFRRRQEQALWEAALMCHNPNVRIYK